MANFLKFSTESTNIFPAANSKLGGQLVSEWNLRSRETVATPSKISYMVGPSYVHSMADFSISTESMNNVNTPTGVLTISEGRGIFNGHFVESTVPITVDLLEKNNELNANGSNTLSGELSIGIRVFYSTNATVADTIRVEKTDNTFMYEGIQVVVLPTSQVKLPIDTPDNASKINMHLKLADFTFIDGAIANVVNNPKKIEAIEAERVANIGEVISENFVKKDNLDPDKFYVYSTRDAKMDNWCEAMDSLIVWDKAPGSRRIDGLSTETYNQYIHELDGVEEAAFMATEDGQVVLRAPHKQIDGSSSIIPDKLLFLPKAEYLTEKAGTVSSEYTKEIKAIASKVSKLIGSGSGKCIGFIDILDNDSYSRASLKDAEKFPSDELVQASNYGDYIIVAADYTGDGLSSRTYKNKERDEEISVAQFVNDNIEAPSTMYMVVAGDILSYKEISSPSAKFADLNSHPAPPTTFKSLVRVAEGYVTDPNDTINIQYINSHFDHSDDGNAPEYVDVKNSGYIRVTQTTSDGKYQDYYAKVSTVMNKISEVPVYITGRQAFATPNTIGGFLDIDQTESTKGQGYVVLDEDGHLRVMDFGYLSQGILAYQLGEDWMPSDTKLDADAIQDELDDSVNARVAFRSDIDWSDTDGSKDNVIHLHLYMPKGTEDSPAVINIHSIDSRFGGSVYLHIYQSSSDTSSTLNQYSVINIRNCEKIRIDSSIPGTPTINVENSNLYYDREVFNALSDVRGLKIWYEKYEDNDYDLQVDGMTVTLDVKPSSPEVFDFWKNKVATNDNHYIYALRSITFGSNGYVVGCSVLLGDSSTSTTSPNSTVVYTGEISLPQSIGFPYPEKRMQNVMKITGSFVSAYGQGQPIEYFIVRETEFSMLIGTYNPNTSDNANYVNGQISLLTKSSKVTSIVGIDNSTETSTKPVCPWRPDSYHVFNGGLI